MTLALNHAFVSNPQGFAQRHPLTLGEPAVNLTRHIKSQSALSFDSSEPSNQGDSKYESVASAHRVAFADITPGTPGLRAADAQVVDIAYEPAPGRFPLFWLPYAQNRTRKLTLKDKRSPLLIRQTGGEARVFLTSVLNGCSVFIEGSAEEPTVYHLNGGSFRVTSSLHPSRDENRQDRIGRSQEMERRFSALPLPKSMAPGRQGGRPGTGVLHGEDYLPNHLLHSELEQAEANLDQAYVADVATTETLPVGAFRDKPLHSALVVGWKSRDTGHWEFWLQTRARVDRVDGTSSRYVGSGLSPFWPGPFNQLVVAGRDTRDVSVKLLSTLSMPRRR